jgi:hypothetical protein
MESGSNTMDADVFDLDAFDDSGDIDDSPVKDRYTAITTADGELVLFDAEKDEAWIQTSNATCLTQTR